MNYREYIEIMQAEGLEQNEFGNYCLEGAIWCNNVIKRLSKETSFDVSSQIKRMEEKKIKYILLAIEWAELGKENETLIKYGERRLRRRMGWKALN